MQSWWRRPIAWAKSRPELAPTAQRMLLGMLVLAGVMGIVGGTWDAAWHVTLQRETFWTPPHLLLYSGTGLGFAASAVAVLGAWLAGWSMPGPSLGRGGATIVALTYTIYTTVAHLVLAALGFAQLPYPPAIIIPAVAVDLFCWARATQRPDWRRGLAAALAFAPLFYIAESASLA